MTAFSFGAAPGFLAYAFVLHNFGLIGWISVIIYAVCGMWRLARFNVNASVIHGYFMGVPIPAGGCLIATWILFSTAMNITPQIPTRNFRLWFTNTNFNRWILTC